MQADGGSSGVSADAFQRTMQLERDRLEDEDDEDDEEDETTLLKMQEKKDEHLMWIAELGLKGPLPEGSGFDKEGLPLPLDWNSYATQSGDIYYHRPSTGETSWEHPNDRHKADGTGWAIAPPKPLFYERGDTEWDDIIEELPQTGTSIVLRHPPPQFITTNLESEALAPEVPEQQDTSNMNRIQIPGQAKVSANGYPIYSKNDPNIKIVYDSVQHNARRSVNKALANKPYYELKKESDTTVVFESLFESGNLYQARQTGPYSYDLVLRNDHNTNGHTQWYYFGVSNVRKGVTYSFRIVNFYKRSSMYNKGLRPLLYSQKMEKMDGIGWHRTGTDVIYKKNDFLYSKPNSTYIHNFYSLSFNIQFPHDDDYCSMAHCYPYTYTDLMLHIGRLEADVEIRKICRRRLLCRTIANNRCDVLTITAPAGVEADDKKADDKKAAEDEAALALQKKKPCVVLSARVHPGETNASWMMKGCIDYLTGNTEGAQKLRKQFVFKIVPMLNPDGVIMGNYRTGLAGVDLNRKWKSPDEDLHPTIFAMKQMMERMRDERGVVMYVDLHGHSVKKNVFIYGCDAKHFDTGENHPTREVPVEFESRLFPAMLGEHCGMFNFQECRFHVKRRKESSGRVVAWRQFTNNSFTLEASFGGADEEHTPPNTHFSIKAFEQIGIDLCITIESLLCKDDPEKEAAKAALLSKISQLALPEGDSDDEGEGDALESSDDGSDDDTVENIVLPKRIVKKRQAKLLAKKKKPKPPVPPKPVEKEKSPERPQKPVKPEPKKEATPREERPKSPERPKEPPKEKPPPEPKKEEAQDIGTSRCNCPSCQAYEEFIASSLPSFPGSSSGPSSGSALAATSSLSRRVSNLGSPAEGGQRGSPGLSSQRMSEAGNGGEQEAIDAAFSRRSGLSSGAGASRSSGRSKLN